jgi:hypothetical protein
MKLGSLRKWVRYAAAALALHVAVLVGLTLLPIPTTHVPAPEPSVSGTQTEVDLASPATQDEQGARPSSLVPMSRSASETNGQLLNAATAARASPPRKSSDGPSAELPATPVSGIVRPPGPGELASRPDDGWSFDPRKPPDVGSPEFIAKALRAETGGAEPAPVGVSTTGGVAEGLDARDVAIGMGRGGPVLSALEAAAAGSDAPMEGTATFDVAIDTGGRVSVVLLDGSKPAGAWAKVGEATRAALDPKRVHIPPGAKGWNVVATLEAKIRYPDGLDQRMLGTQVKAVGLHLTENLERSTARNQLGGPDSQPSAFEDQPSMQAVVAATSPFVFDDRPPGIWIIHQGKVCRVEFNLLFPISVSGGCDPANIGANTLRTVHGHIVSESRL